MPVLACFLTDPYSISFLSFIVVPLHFYLAWFSYFLVDSLVAYLHLYFMYILDLHWEGHPPSLSTWIIGTTLCVRTHISSRSTLGNQSIYLIPRQRTHCHRGSPASDRTISTSHGNSDGNSVSKECCAGACRMFGSWSVCTSVYRFHAFFLQP